MEYKRVSVALMASEIKWDSFFEFSQTLFCRVYLLLHQYQSIILTRAFSITTWYFFTADFVLLGEIVNASESSSEGLLPGMYWSCTTRTLSLLSLGNGIFYSVCCDIQQQNDLISHKHDIFSRQLCMHLNAKHENDRHNYDILAYRRTNSLSHPSLFCWRIVYHLHQTDYGRPSAGDNLRCWLFDYNHPGDVSHWLSCFLPVQGRPRKWFRTICRELICRLKVNTHEQLSF